MKKILPLLLLICTLFSCSDGDKKVQKNNEKNYKLELNEYLANHYTQIETPREKVSVDSLNWVDLFYKNNKFATIWIDDSLNVSNQGVALIDSLSKAEYYGLTANTYKTATLAKLKQELSKIEDKSKRYEIASKIEVSLTNSYFLFGKHLNYGVLDSINNITGLPRKKFKLNMPQYLEKAYKSDSLIEKLYDLQPTIPQYKRLQKGLTYYLNNSSMSTDNVPVKSFRIDSVKAIIQSKKALVLHEYLDSVVNDSLYFIALKKFQLDHALKSDGLIGNNTAKALSMSPYDYYLKLVANLEMWRWKEPLESNHIFVNIPAYKLELSQNNEVAFESRVVVGKKKNETPEIKDSLSYIIAYPYWNVPRKISLEEVVLKARRDSTYFKRNNFELLNYNRTSVDVSTIDWKAINKKNFKYYVRQRGGGSNSLGLVKFIFPNKHAVYIHDTPSKSYFNREIRAYSHGCVRVEKPMALAEHLLAADKNKNDIDSVYKFIEKKKEKPLKLNKKVAVYIYYFTADADENGKVTLYQDIYDIDRKLTHLLIQKRNEFKS